MDVKLRQWSLKRSCMARRTRRTAIDASIAPAQARRAAWATDTTSDEWPVLGFAVAVANPGRD
jgi:hypothetical protein